MWVVWLVAELGDWLVGWLVSWFAGCWLVDSWFSGLVDWSVGSSAGRSFSRLFGQSVFSSVRWLVSQLTSLSFIQSVISSFLMFVGHLCCCVFHLVRRSPGLVICMVGLSLVQSVVW